MAVSHYPSTIVLYCDESSIPSHQVRIVLEEKGVEYTAEFLKPNAYSAALLTLNPYRTLPTLVDRKLALYDAKIIMMYLEERLPHPPLLPAFAVGRAECSQQMYRIEHDICRRIYDLDLLHGKDLRIQRTKLAELVMNLVSNFNNSKYGFEDEFSLVDCYLAPILWRLPSLGVDTSESSKALLEYSERLFSRASFQKSLTDAEQALRENID